MNEIQNQGDLHGITLHTGPDMLKRILVSIYVYLQPDPAVRGAQLNRRRERACLEVPVKVGEPEIGDPVIIQILLTLLHHRGAKAADVVRYLRGYSPPITMAEVRMVFTRYGLDSIGKKGGASNC